MPHYPIIPHLPLIGMGVRQPYVDTYSFIQFSTYDDGHSVTYVKATVESGKLRRLELRKISAIGCHFPPKSISFYNCDWGGGGESTIGGPNLTLGGAEGHPKSI